MGPEHCSDYPFPDFQGPRYDGSAEIGEVEEEDEAADLVHGLGRDFCLGIPPPPPRRIPLIRPLRDLIAPFAVFGRAREASELAQWSPRKHIVSMAEGDWYGGGGGGGGKGLDQLEGHQVMEIALQIFPDHHEYPDHFP